MFTIAETTIQASAVQDYNAGGIQYHKTDNCLPGKYISERAREALENTQTKLADEAQKSSEQTP